MRDSSENLKPIGKETEENLRKALKKEEETEHLIDLFIIILFLIFIIYTFL